MSHKDDINVLSGRLHRIIGTLCDFEDDLGTIYDEMGVPERTCQLVEDGDLLLCECGVAAPRQSWQYWNYCPNCGAKVVSE